ncbi:MAG: NAD(P)-dependent glycerol-3-phosphate dehydrogenase [bacterium]
MKKSKVSKLPKIAVLGDGGWGTTLAVLLHKKGADVTLWGAFPEYVELLKKRRVNEKFLPGIELPRRMQISAELDEAVGGAGVIVTAIPSNHMRRVCRRMAAVLRKRGNSNNVLIVSGSKGIEIATLRRMSQVITGPSHAEEVSRGGPTTVVVAASNERTAVEAQSLLMTERFRVYTNHDIIGVEIGGAIKNVIAIAAGACDGLGFGDNAKAALITRGMVEITRLGVAMGAKAGTFWGLAGIGDLITTCVSRYGRNRKVGEMIARGKKLKQIMAGTEMVAEGILTAKAARKLSQRYRVEMPITEQIYAVLYRGKDPEKAVRELMMRSPKAEADNA